MVSPAKNIIFILSLAYCISLNFAQDLGTLDSGMYKSNLQRNLSTCGSYSACSECNVDDQCTWINSRCVDDPGLSIKTEDFNQKFEHIYCRELSSSGDLVLTSENEFTLSHSNVVDLQDHPLCRWTIKVDPSMLVQITVKRSPSQAEDIVITRVSEDDPIASLISRAYSPCDGSTTSMSYRGLEYLTVHAKIFSEHPGYEITIKKDEDSSPSKSTTFIILGVCWCFVWVLLMILGAIIAFQVNDHCKRKNKIKWYYSYIAKLEEAKDKRVEDTLAAMLSGEYQNIQSKFSEDSCVICLEQFEQTDRVNITNECNHMFHSQCLKEWYSNISILKDLLCAHCNTVNTPNSKPDLGRNSYDEENIINHSNSDPIESCESCGEEKENLIDSIISSLSKKMPLSVSLPALNVQSLHFSVHSR